MAPVAARVSVLTGGTMAVTRESDRTGTAASVNTALLPGDTFSTNGASTRAEIQFDGYTALRLGGEVRGRIAADDAHARRIEIASGLTELSRWRGEQPAAEIVTPALTLRTQYAGSYRIAVAPDGTTSVTARSGQADAVVPGKTYALVAGRTLEARVWAGKVSVTVGSAVARDDFDAFNTTRDQVLSAALDDSAHLPASLGGYDDLAGYGTWANLAPYGQVWVPQQTAGWAPYRDGSWDYDTGYGWTWVGAEPWGWVPYHYGSWIYSNPLGWCWYPPPVGLSPVWAPGLVAFFGYGAGPFGYSGYGWVPLAPYEPYYPWYPYPWYPYPWYPYGSPPPPPKKRPHPPPKMSPGALAAYRNARDGGISTIGAQGWQNGQASHPVAIDPRHLVSVKLVEGRLPMTPPHVRVATPLHAAPSGPARAPAASAQSAPWADEFVRAATMLDGLDSAPAHGTVPSLPVMRSPLHQMPGSTLHEVPPGAPHQPPSTLHEVTPGAPRQPPSLHQVSPPAVRQPPAMHADPPISIRSGSTRPPA